MTNKFNVVQFGQWKKARTSVLKDIKYKQISAINAAIIPKLHAELFNHDLSRPNCANSWKEYIKALEAAYENYVKDHKKPVKKKVTKAAKKTVNTKIKK